MERNILEQLDEKVKGGIYFNGNMERCAELDITFHRLYDLYYIVAGANFNLLKAADEKLTLDGYKYSDENVLRTFLRTEYLKSCLLSYNSVEDYVMQIITFAFNLKGNRISSKKDYYSKSRNNFYYKLEDKIKGINNEEIYRLAKEYNGNMKRIKKLCNELKHNNNIQFKELPYPSYVGFASQKYKSDWLKPKAESLDELIDVCYEANAIIVKYIKDLYDILNEKYRLDILN
ncbi:MAG: hypothetical protein RR851_14350 [Clostridium sp.]